MIGSRLNALAQTTIPQPVRDALHLREGDALAYTIEPGRVIVTRVEPDIGKPNPFAAFSERESSPDSEAFQEPCASTAETDPEGDEAELRSLAAAIAQSDADSRRVPHEEVRAWLLRIVAGEFDAPPPTPR